MSEKTYPSLDEAKTYARDFRSVPVSRTILSDIRTPVEVMRALKRVSRHCFILESLEDSARWGRYTFLGFDPKLEFTCADGVVRLRSGTTVTIPGADPAEYIRRIIGENRSPRLPGLPPFTGGLMGYFAYDSVKYVEPTLKLGGGDEEKFNDIDLMLFDKIIAFDNLKQTITMIVNVRTDGLEENYRAALLALDMMEELIRRAEPAENPPLRLKSGFTPLFSQFEYCAMVEKARHYIYEGDIFQVVLSNRLTAEAEGSLLDTYRLLRTLNPSPYMFYISSDNVEIAGSSPETLVKLEDGVLHTFPLAGTRPRGKDEAEDKALEKALLADPKELAEHNMLVDLGRNDLGRLSEFGSVEVEKYLSIERRIKTRSTPSALSFPPEPFPARRRSAPAKSSTNWNSASGASTAERSATSISPETWTHASRSVWHSRRTEKSSSGQARESLPTRFPNGSTRNVSTRRRP